MSNKIQIGDHVRYLNASGGGVVRRIEKNVAWVEGEDGFELPTPIHQCVVVGESDSFIPAYQTPAEKRKQQSQQASKPAKSVLEAPRQPQPEPERPIKRIQVDRPDGEELNLSIAFLPVDMAQFGQCAYEMYLINESNYEVTFFYLARKESGQYHLRATDYVDPDGRVFVDEVALNELNNIEYALFQFVAYKRDKAFVAKQPLHIEHRIDTIKLFKRHVFQHNPYFDDEAWVIQLVQNDKNAFTLPSSQELNQKREDTLRQKVRNDQARQQSKTVERTGRRAKKTPPDEIDLHVNALLETTSGMPPHELLQHQLTTFKHELDARVKTKGSRAVFIHGKGQGVLRQEIIKIIQTQYTTLSYRDASFQEYGFGAIEVTFH